jgi:predicted transcriptional regulator
MTSITINLPDDIVQRLTVQAERLKTSLADLTEAFVIRGIEDEEGAQEGWDPSLTPEDIVAIKAGLADIEVGRTIPHEIVFEELRKRLSQ